MDVQKITVAYGVFYTNKELEGMDTWEDEIIDPVTEIAGVLYDSFGIPDATEEHHGAFIGAVESVTRTGTPDTLSQLMADPAEPAELNTIATDPTWDELILKALDLADLPHKTPKWYVYYRTEHS